MKKIIILIAILISCNHGIFAQQQCSAVSLDGVDEYLQSPFSTYNFDNFTIEFWMNAPIVNNGVNYVFLYENYQIAVSSTWTGLNKLDTWAWGLNPVSMGPSPTFPLNSWHHLAFTYDGSLQKLYIDGVTVLDSVTSDTLLHETWWNNGLTVGARYSGDMGFAKAVLDEVRIWNLARSQTEIQTWSQYFLYGNEPGLIAYYPFEDGTGSDTATDQTGHGNTLNFINMEPANDWVTGICIDNPCPEDKIISVQDSSVCPGDSTLVYIAASDAGVTYTLRVNTTPVSFAVAGTGGQISLNTGAINALTTFNILADRAATACDRELTQTVNVDILPTYAITDSASICDGELYNWQAGTFGVPGTFYATMTSSLGCDSVRILVLSMNMLPVASISGLDSFYCNTATPPVLTTHPSGGVLWGDGIQDSAFFPASLPFGAYTIYYYYTDSNGCSDSAKANTIVGDCAGIDDNSNNSSLEISPNPTSGFVYISTSDISAGILTIYNSLGEILLCKPISGMQTELVDFINFRDGIYQVRIQTENAVRTSKVIKQ